jgi:hypothetical protein
MFVKTKIASIYGTGNLWKSHNLTSLTNQGPYEFPADYTSIMCGGKTEIMVKRIHTTGNMTFFGGQGCQK